MAALKGWQHRRHRNPMMEYNPDRKHHKHPHHTTRHRIHRNPANPVREHLGFDIEEGLAALVTFFAAQKAGDLVFPAPAGYSAKPWDHQQLKEIAAQAGATVIAGFIGHEVSPKVKTAAILGGVVKVGAQIIAQFNIDGLAKPGSLIVGDHPTPLLSPVVRPIPLSRISNSVDLPVGASVARA